MKLHLVVLIVYLLKIGKCLPTTSDQEKLIAVAAVSRHGDRAPFTSFPTDKYYNLTYWPMGFGQLTKKGIDRQYKLGQWLRQRYNGFLSEYYHPNEIYASSTDLDRTLMSAAANLAGLFPPKGHQLWNERILWQPVPVHIADFISLIETKDCPNYHVMLKKFKDKLFPSYEKINANVLQYISNNTGWKKVTVEMVDELMDLLFTYEQHDISYVPSWSKSMDHNITRHLSAVAYELPTHTVQLARLRIGTYYDNLFNFFNKFVNSSSTSQQKSKFQLIMAHESTLIAILNTIGAYKMQHVEYADTIIWELKKKKDGYFVNVLYKHKNELNGIKVLKCDFNCGYLELKQSLAHVTVSTRTWLKECFA